MIATSRSLRCLAGLMFVSLLAGCAANKKSTAELEPMLPAQDQAAIQGSDLRIASSALQSGDLNLAKKTYARLVKNAPDMIEAWQGLGDTQYQAGEFEAAKGTYNQAMQRFPDLIEPRLALARIDIRQRKLDTAAAYYQAILAQHPDDPQALAGLGATWDLRGDSSQAQAIYRRGLAKNPDDVALRTNLGLSLALNGSPREAINVLLGVNGVSGKLPQERANLAFAYGLLGRDDAAESILTADLPQSVAQDNIEFYHYVRERIDVKGSAKTAHSKGSAKP
jgi:Flp pilus assembly protein TadD